MVVVSLLESSVPTVTATFPAPSFVRRMVLSDPRLESITREPRVSSISSVVTLSTNAPNQRVPVTPRSALESPAGRRSIPELRVRAVELRAAVSPPEVSIVTVAAPESNLEA